MSTVFNNGTGVENGKPAQDPRGPELLRSVIEPDPTLNARAFWWCSWHLKMILFLLIPYAVAHPMVATPAGIIQKAIGMSITLPFPKGSIYLPTNGLTNVDFEFIINGVRFDLKQEELISLLTNHFRGYSLTK